MTYPLAWIIITIAVLVDLSAAFDTVDHTIILNIFQNRFSVEGDALGWFSTYLNPTWKYFHRKIAAYTIIVHF